MTKFISNGVEFKVGDKVRVVSIGKDRDGNGMGEGVQWRNSWTTEMSGKVGQEFTIKSIGDTGAYFEEGGWLGYPLNVLINLSVPAMLKKGDVVRCNDHTRLFVTYGKEYTLQADQTTDSILIHDNDGDRARYAADKFTLVRSATAPRKLKLPLAVNRHLLGRTDVLVAGTEPGTVVAIDPADGRKATYTEAQVFTKFEDGAWLVVGSDTTELTQKVVDAKAAYEAAQEAVTAAEAVVAAAEAELASAKPYLA